MDTASGPAGRVSARERRPPLRRHPMQARCGTSAPCTRTLDPCLPPLPPHVRLAASRSVARHATTPCLVAQAALPRRHPRFLLRRALQRRRTRVHPRLPPPPWTPAQARHLTQVKDAGGHSSIDKVHMPCFGTCSSLAPSHLPQGPLATPAASWMCSRATPTCRRWLRLSRQPISRPASPRCGTGWHGCRCGVDQDPHLLELLPHAHAHRALRSCWPPPTRRSTSSSSSSPRRSTPSPPTRRH